MGVACSFGFIEHFWNLEEVIERHVKLVKPGGTLILAAPNFRGLQYAFDRLLDAANLRRHVIKAMDLRAWREILLRNGMIPLHHG